MRGNAADPAGRDPSSPALFRKTVPPPVADVTTPPASDLLIGAVNFTDLKITL